MGQISISIKGFKNAIDAKPEHPEAYFGIIEAYVKSGNMEAAKEFAEKGKEIDPDSSEYFDELLNK
jgi:tetratricopeptide (TPR) repeat protein